MSVSRKKSRRWSFEEAAHAGWISKDEIPPAGPRLTRAKRRDIEEEEQTQLVDEFERTWPELSPCLMHIPNGGSRKNRFEGYRLKRAGVRPGVSDLLLAVPMMGPEWPMGFCPGMFMEFKAAPPNDAAVSVSQKNHIELMRARGYRALVCRGVPEAMAVFRSYLSQGEIIRVY